MNILSMLVLKWKITDCNKYVQNKIQWKVYLVKYVFGTKFIICYSAWAYACPINPTN